jgi:hypothetical protein
MIEHLVTFLDSFGGGVIKDLLTGAFITAVALIILKWLFGDTWYTGKRKRE